MGDIEKLEARLDAALVRVKAARADGQRAENEALDLMIQIGTHSARKAEVERDAAVARAEAAEARATLAEADLDALARTVGAAIVAGSLASGESLTSPPQHAIVSTVNRLRARAEAAEAALAAANARADHAVHRAAKAEVDVDEADVRCDGFERLLSEGLEIVESLSAGHDVWAAQVRRALGV
jgi:hypothetical protein